MSGEGWDPAKTVLTTSPGSHSQASSHQITPEYTIYHWPMSSYMFLTIMEQTWTPGDRIYYYAKCSRSTARLIPWTVSTPPCEQFKHSPEEQWSMFMDACWYTVSGQYRTTWYSCYDIIRNYCCITIVIAAVPTLIKI